MNLPRPFCTLCRKSAAACDMCGSSQDTRCRHGVCRLFVFTDPLTNVGLCRDCAANCCSQPLPTAFRKRKYQRLCPDNCNPKAPSPDCDHCESLRIAEELRHGLSYQELRESKFNLGFFEIPASLQKMKEQ